MAEPANLDDLPQATVVPKKRARLSVVWIIPILVAVVAIGVAIQRTLNEGPTITIVFKAAEGIEAGKTFIKYKDVSIGQVTAVQLTDDYGKVEVKAKIAKSAQGLIAEDAKFWVVRPIVSLSGISGLSTLFSGNYIGFDAGKSDRSQRTFTALDVPPIITGQPGRQFVLNADDLGSLAIGSPIYYRRLPVGQVIAYDLAADGKSVQIKVFVNAPYDKYVTSETHFWNASGLDVSVNANGVNVHTESVAALLVGGLAFDTPSFSPQAADAAANSVFTLYRDRSTAMKAPDSVARRYVLHFRESLRGLAVGAPVTFLGLPAGEVASIGLSFDAAKADIRPRVVITFYPERLIAYASTEQGASLRAQDEDKSKRDLLLKRLIEERGLRGQLRSGNLITGQLYVAFDYFPNTPKVKINLSPENPELPVVPGPVVDLEAKLASILDKVDKLPLAAIGNDLKKDLEALDQTLQNAKQLLSDVDVQLVPELKSDLEGLHRTLAAVERAMNSADTTLLGADAPAQQELRAALQEFTRAAQSVRALTDYLERHPESALRGKSGPARGAN
jgi:paraquat-inducible protein B